MTDVFGERFLASMNFAAGFGMDDDFSVEIVLTVDQHHSTHPRPCVAMQIGA
jgi:hypothetical protein